MPPKPTLDITLREPSARKRVAPQRFEPDTEPVTRRLKLAPKAKTSGGTCQVQPNIQVPNATPGDQQPQLVPAPESTRAVTPPDVIDVDESQPMEGVVTVANQKAATGGEPTEDSIKKRLGLSVPVQHCEY